MDPKTVIDHFGGIVETAKALNVSRQVVYTWIWKRSIPVPRQYQIQVISRGKLRA